MEVIIVAALVLSLFLTGATRWYALRSSLLDVPNERSMHEHPIPHGGGIAIVVVFLAGALWMAWRGDLPRELALALLPSGALVAAMGWYDDRHTLSNPVRIALWFPAAIWAVYWLGGLPNLHLGTFTIHLGIAGSIIAVIGVVWVLNLYNFMDGTDGLAGTQAVTAATAAGLLLWHANPNLSALSWLLAAASLGFLLWNWPAAKIFMGDVGSGFLGFAFAVLAIHSENTASLPLAIWAILLAVFFIDATLTVARRIKHGEKWSQPHRSHAYQVQARQHSHAKVLWTFIAIEIVLMGAAYASWRWTDTMLPILVIVVVGLGIGWRHASRDAEATQF